MPSTYTTNLGIEKIATGEQSGTWGTTTNTNLDLIDTAVNGIVSITLASAGTSGSPNDLPITDGTASNGRNKFIEFVDGGDLGATAYVQLTPNDAEKIVHIRNSLSGSRSIIVFQGTYNASNDFEIPNGADVTLKFNGAGTGATVTDVNVDLTVTGATIATADINGGTIDGTVIGGSSAAAGTFTTFTSTGIDDNATSTAITIDASENVGIGTTSPSSALHLYGTGSPIRLNIEATTGRVESRLDNTSGAFIFGIDDSGGAGFGSAYSRNIYSNGAYPMLFWTNNAERMRIDSSGNVGIGGSISTAKLYVVGSTNDSTQLALRAQNLATSDLFFVRNDGAINTGSAALSLYNNTVPSAANVVVNSYGYLERSTSSARYKENIRDYTGSIDALRPVMFNSINEGDDKDYAGFIAEEVHEAGLHEFVQYDAQDRPDAVNYANMVALLVKEIQDLKAEVAALKGA